MRKLLATTVVVACCLLVAVPASTQTGPIAGRVVDADSAEELTRTIHEPSTAEAQDEF
jgi:hypothetical protein